MSCARRKQSKLSDRLTRTYALLFALSTLAFSLIVYAASWHALIDRQKESLTVSARRMTAVYHEEIEEGHAPDAPEVLWEMNTNGDMALLLLADGGSVIAQSGIAGISASEIPDCTGKTVLYAQRSGMHLLAHASALALGPDAPAALVVLQSIDAEYHYLQMLFGLLLALNAAGACVALAVGRYAAVRLLSPLSGMIRKARTIDAHALHTRLLVPQADDELRLLAQTLNDMLERVASAFARQQQFTQDASHELRTPLSVLQGNAELLARWGKDEPAVRDTCIAAIQRQTAYMHRLIENLLFLARADEHLLPLRATPVDLPALFAEIIEDCRALDPAHVYTVKAAQGLSLTADPTLLREYLLIVLDNAAKYTPEGKGIHLQAEAIEAGVRITLTDEGCGVAPDDLERIFERFYRVDKARSRETGGTGLGLSIARSIVALRGGSLCAESADGGGLRILATFPAKAS